MSPFRIKILVIILLGVFSVPVIFAEDFESNITFTAVTYDDGSGRALKQPTWAFFDNKANELYVTDVGNHRIIIFDKDLMFKYSFKHFVKDRHLDRRIEGEPKAVITNSYGDMIVIDNLADYLDILDFRGDPLDKIYPNLLLNDSTLKVKPVSLCIDNNDNIYVIVVGDVTQIMVLDEDFNLKRTFGKKGGNEKDFNMPIAIATKDSLIWVTDIYAKPAVKVFDTLGNYIFGFGMHDVKRADVSLPSAIVITQDSVDNQLIWIVDALRQVIKVYNDKGEFLSFVGDFGHQLGEFQYPMGLTVTKDNVFYVVEKIGNRIQRFRLKK